MKIKKEILYVTFFKLKKKFHYEYRYKRRQRRRGPPKILYGGLHPSPRGALE